MSSSQSTPKLFYFDLDGRAEVLRLLFVLAGKEFEEVRYPLDDLDVWFKTAKQTMPFEVVPVLEIDGERYGESIALNTYLAKEYGFHGQTNLEELKINQIAQLIESIMVPSSTSYDEPDPAKKAELVQNIKTAVAPKYQRFIENAVQKFGGKEFAVGDRFTLADILIYDLYKGFLRDYIDTSGEYPLSKAIAERLAENEKVKAWNKKTCGQ